MKNNFKMNIPIAILITLMAVIYQRATGPTYPKKFKIGDHKMKLFRSHGGETNAPVEIPKITQTTTGKITYKRYPTNDEWTTLPLEDKGNMLIFGLPNQPPAGKLKYFVELDVDGKKEFLGTEADPIIIRYKGEVPTAVLAPHIFFMFFSMLLSVLAALEAARKNEESFYLLTKATVFCLVVGGLILGPIVQKYAFGVYWAGFPFDWDLTDNKLLVAVLAWGIAFALNWKKRNRYATIAAAVVLICVYSIPHSMQGSEFDYEKGKVTTDMD